MTGEIRTIGCRDARTLCVSGDRIAVARRPEGPIQLGRFDLSELRELSLPFPVGLLCPRSGGGFHAFGPEGHVELDAEGGVLETGSVRSVVWGAGQGDDGALWVVRHTMEVFCRRVGTDAFEEVGRIPVPRRSVERFLARSGCVVGPEGVWSLTGNRLADFRGASRVGVDSDGRFVVVVGRTSTRGWSVRVLDPATGERVLDAETAHVVSVGTVHDGSVWMAIRDGFLQWAFGSAEPVRFVVPGLISPLQMHGSAAGLLLRDVDSLCFVPWDALGDPVSLPPLADLDGWSEGERRVFRMLEAQARKHVPADVSASDHARFATTLLPDLARVLTTAREIEMVLPLLASWSPMALVQRKSMGLPDTPEALADSLDRLRRLDPSVLEVEVAREIDRNLGLGVRSQIEAEVAAARVRLVEHLES